MVGEDQANLKSKVFFVWGALCTGAFIFAFFLVPETKGLSLEQVDRMLEETTPRTSAKWRPSNLSNYESHKLGDDTIEDVEHKGAKL